MADQAVRSVRSAPVGGLQTVVWKPNVVMHFIALRLQRVEPRDEEDTNWMLKDGSRRLNETGDRTRRGRFSPRRAGTVSETDRRAGAPRPIAGTSGSGVGRMTRVCGRSGIDGNDEQGHDGLGWGRRGMPRSQVAAGGLTEAGTERTNVNGAG